MTSKTDRNFANQDLRNQSFRGKNLRNADFSHSDLRGCNFSHANLVRANLSGARTGWTTKQVSIALVVAVGVALLVAEAVIKTGFGALGQTPGDRGWTYVVALRVSLGLAGAGLAARQLLPSRVGAIAEMLSTIASGAFTCFFWGGSLTENNPQVAIVSAVVGGLLVIPLRWCFKGKPLFCLGVASAGAVASYGFALLVGTWAIALYSGDRGVAGTVWILLCLLYLWFVLLSLQLTIQQWKAATGTSFRSADLTDACFDGATVQNTDFSGAIGYPTGESTNLGTSN